MKELGENSFSFNGVVVDLRQIQSFRWVGEDSAVMAKANKGADGTYGHGYANLHLKFYGVEKDYVIALIHGDDIKGTRKGGYADGLNGMLQEAVRINNDRSITFQESKKGEWLCYEGALVKVCKSEEEVMAHAVDRLRTERHITNIRLFRYNESAPARNMTKDNPFLT